MAVKVIDFETYYDKEYSLKKLQTDEYIYDKRFEIILVAVNDQWFSGTLEETKEWLLSAIDFDQDILIAHHAAFDGFILSERLGLVPKKPWVDTLSMARAALPFLKKHSLDALAKYYKLGEKGGYVVHALGKHRADFTPDELQRYAEYCLHDVELTGALAYELKPLTADVESAVIDMTIRMFTEPRILLDADILRDCHIAEIQRKEELINNSGVTKADLMSNVKFADVLKARGVKIPYKVSPRTREFTYAFAKSDKEFTDLLDHPDEEVVALVEARLGIKSTIAETRAGRMRATAMRGRGLFPIMLNYWGARNTGRHAGGNKINPQNFPARARGSEIRKAMIAPPGHSIIVADSSNIELRVAMACAGQTDALDALRNGEDLYCQFASKIYGREIFDIPEHQHERMLGKIAMLMLQYGAGYKKFKETVRLWTKKEISATESLQIVELYRATYTQMRDLWRYCDSTVLPAIANGDLFVPVDQNNWFQTTPNGFAHPGLPGVVYADLRRVGDSWVYGEDKSIQTIHGGKMVENLSQHMARHVFMWQTACVHQKYPVSLSVHDELVCVVRDAEAYDAAEYIHGVLDTTPAWCRDKLPLSCKVKIAKSYGDAK